MTFNLQRLFLGHDVTVESFGYLIKGKLVYCQDSDKNGHVPNVLILESLKGRKLILREWNVIKVEGGS